MTAGILRLVNDLKYILNYLCQEMCIFAYFSTLEASSSHYSRDLSISPPAVELRYNEGTPEKNSAHLDKK